MIDEKYSRITGQWKNVWQRAKHCFEGEVPVFYYQVLSGTMKMNNYNRNGNERNYTGNFTKGQSFGEPAIWGDFPSQQMLEAVENTHLICLEK